MTVAIVDCPIGSTPSLARHLGRVGKRYAPAVLDMAKNVRELQVWQRAEALARAVFATTDDPRFRPHPRLREQLNDSAGSVLANIAEGFSQTSDKAFARFLTIARGSCNEVSSHLAVAEIRRCVDQDVRERLEQAADEINRMLTGLERYLRRSDRKVRF